jgi:hypothetical protein
MQYSVFMLFIDQSNQYVAFINRQMTSKLKMKCSSKSSNDSIDLIRNNKENNYCDFCHENHFDIVV